MTDDGTLINLYAPFGFEEIDLLGQRVQAWTWGEPDSVRPPGTIVVSQGLCTGPKNELSFDEPMANSSMLVLPRHTLPAALNFSMRWHRTARRSSPASWNRRW